LGNYNDKDVYLYASSKYKSNSIFYSPNYYLLPKWADPEKLTLMQAIKIINFRMKNKHSDNINVNLMEESKNADISIKKNNIYIIEME
jgi:hypothetical protein